MKKVIELAIIGLAMMMVVGALTPADVVRKAIEPEKPLVNTHGVNASVFKTDAFANQNILGKNFSTLPVGDDTLSNDATQNFANSTPPLFKNVNEPFHSDTNSRIFKVEAGSSIDAFLNSKNVTTTNPGQSIEDFLNSVNTTKVNATSVNATSVDVTKVNATRNG